MGTGMGMGMGMGMRRFLLKSDISSSSRYFLYTVHVLFVGGVCVCELWGETFVVGFFRLRFGRSSYTNGFFFFQIIFFKLFFFLGGGRGGWVCLLLLHLVLTAMAGC
jgi:hypothetical protein